MSLLFPSHPFDKFGNSNIPRELCIVEFLTCLGRNSLEFESSIAVQVWRSRSHYDINVIYFSTLPVSFIIIICIHQIIENIILHMDSKYCRSACNHIFSPSFLVIVPSYYVILGARNSRIAASIHICPGYTSMLLNQYVS